MTSSVWAPRGWCREGLCGNETAIHRVNNLVQQPAARELQRASTFGTGAWRMVWHAVWYRVWPVDRVEGTRACNGHFNGIDREGEGLMNVGAGGARTNVDKPGSLAGDAAQRRGTRWVVCMQEG